MTSYGKRLSRKESALGKVVLHSLDHQIHRGFSKAEFIGDTVKLIDKKGNEQEFPTHELKAIFFVKDFKGNPRYDEVTFLCKEAPSPWVWLHLEFQDGEVLECRTSNSMDLFTQPGFFVWPSDELANTEMVYVVKSSLADLKVVGVG